MPTNRNVIDFKIHNLTEEQFQELKDAGQIDPNALYCTPDETVVKIEELSERIDAANEQISAKQDVATAINYGHVTNCITEIPQDIKLELNNGTLTLKAGSKVYVPNGAGVFDIETVNVDIPFALSVNNTYMLFKQQGKDIIDFIPKESAYSGPNISFGDGYGDYVFGYDTESNSCGLYENDGKSHYNLIRNESLPICIFTVSNGAISSIDQVFNGFGYIGSTVFDLPGVKGLIPDGRNEDGSLKNLEVAVSSVQIFTATGYGYGIAYGLYSNGEISARNNACYAEGSKPTWFDNGLYGTWFDTESNKMLYTEDAGTSWTQIHMVMFGSMYMTNAGQLDYLKTKTTFRAVDYNDLTNTTTIAVSAGIVSAFAGTTPPAGWLKCDGSAISRTLYADLFAAIGTLYGAGDGSTTFNLPNLIDGRVPFGMPSNYVGQSTEGVLPNITGQFATSGTNQSGSGAIWYTHVSSGAQGWSGTGASNGQWDFNANRSNSMYGGGWFEGRKVVPASVGMTYCIKY